MSEISQELLDKLNKEQPEPNKPTGLDDFNKEYDAVLSEMGKRKKKKVVEDTSYIPGDRLDSEFDKDDGSADHIPGGDSPDSKIDPDDHSADYIPD